MVRFYNIFAIFRVKSCEKLNPQQEHLGSYTIAELLPFFCYILFCYIFRIFSISRFFYPRSVIFDHLVFNVSNKKKILRITYEDIRDRKSRMPQSQVGCQVNIIALFFQSCCEVKLKIRQMNPS